MFADFPSIGFIGLHRLHKGEDYALAVTKAQLIQLDAAGYKYDGCYDLAPGGVIPLNQYQRDGFHIYRSEKPEGWNYEGLLTMVHPVGVGPTMFSKVKDGSAGHLPTTLEAEGVTAGWKGVRAAWLAIIGVAVFWFNFIGINLLVTGLHSYAGI